MKNTILSIIRKHFKPEDVQDKFQKAVKRYSLGVSDYDLEANIVNNQQGGFYMTLGKDEYFLNKKGDFTYRSRFEESNHKEDFTFDSAEAAYVAWLEHIAECEVYGIHTLRIDMVSCRYAMLE